MKILALLQDFNAEQESQNLSIKTKMKGLESEVDKRYKLFKAYTSHDSLVGKIEEATKKSQNLEKMLLNKDK